MTEPRGGFPVGLTVAVAIAFAILAGLGTWQVQRLHWKEGLLARIAALQAAPARPLEPVLDEVSKGGDADFTRVKATCPGLATAPYVELYAIRDGQAGVRLISACRSGSLRYRSVLVDRGFVADTISARPAVDAASTAPLEVTGILRRPERGNLFSPANTPARWYTRDVASMAAALKAPEPAPLVLMAETATNPEWKALIPAPIPADIPNRHLEYAITWYGLAAVLLGVYAAMLVKRRKT
ncbi:MAG TPA: SURF1 family cytochrome oxidase biogenesis protein [Phenylobacterium sp.]|nr:SURF1 family cytochrome oxidase biogenesis protein [Phenylobacterium sp.]